MLFPLPAKAGCQTGAAPALFKRPIFAIRKNWNRVDTKQFCEPAGLKTTCRALRFETTFVYIIKGPLQIKLVQMVGRLSAMFSQ
jgi:hypothetical protein